MTQQDQIDLRDRLRVVLGDQSAATMWAMLSANDQVATKGDLSTLGRDLRTEMSELRSELKSEMGELRSEMAYMRQEMDLKYATKADLVDMKESFDQSFHAYVRTFMATQAATVVGVTGIVYALVRLT